MKQVKINKYNRFSLYLSDHKIVYIMLYTMTRYMRHDAEQFYQVLTITFFLSEIDGTNMQTLSIFICFSTLMCNQNITTCKAYNER